MFWNKKKSFLFVRENEDAFRETVDSLYQEIDELFIALRELREEVDYLIDFLDEDN